MILVDALERRVQTMVLVAGMARAAGAEQDLPDWDKARADFDEYLSSEPKPVTPEDADQQILLQGLGLR